MSTHDHLRAGFTKRVGLSRWAAAIGLRGSRLLVAAALAILPASALIAFAAFGPVDFRRAFIDPASVHDVFRSLMGAVATASSIAVSLATLTMRRDLKGLQSHEARQESTDEYRRRVRDSLDTRELPLRLGPFMADALDGVAERSRALIERIPASALAITDEGMTLRSFLETLAERASHTAASIRAERDRPDAILLATLDLEDEVMARLLHRAARHEVLPDAERDELARVRDLFSDYVLAQKFLTTLDTQWGLRRMSAAILISTLPSILAASVMGLSYGEGAVDALGERGAALLVGVALAAVLFPLACFVSYILRFLVLNQQTLPADGFLLGPESRLHSR